MYVRSYHIVTFYVFISEERTREGVPKRVIIHGQPPNQDNNNNGDSNGRLIILPDSIQLLFDVAGQFHSFTTYVTYLYILIYILSSLRQENFKNRLSI